MQNKVQCRHFETACSHGMIINAMDGNSIADIVSGPNDVFIAIMGVTGAGKSTFISKCCDKAPGIGHNLQACECFGVPI